MNQFFSHKITALKTELKANAFAYILMALTWLIFFSPLLFAGQVYFQDDLKIFFFPLETEYAQFQHAWQLPQWSNEFGFGQPLLGWGQLGFFTPLHLVLRALYVPPLILLQISMMTYLLFGQIGMFIWLKSKQLNQYAAALGAILFILCGFTIGHLNHVNFYTSTMLLPWLLLSAEAVMAKPTVRRGTILSIVAASIAVSGQPQVVTYTYTIAAIILICQFVGDFFQDYSLDIKILAGQMKTQCQTWFSKFTHLPKRVKIILAVIVAGALTVALSSFATLPLLEFLPQTERADSLSLSDLFDFSYPGYHAVTLVLPYFFGGHDDYWGPKGFQELAAFTGFIPLWLAGLALGTWRTHKKQRIAAIILITIAGLMGLGQYSFFYNYLVNNHILVSFSIPGRFVFFFDIGIILLATLGLHDLATAFTANTNRRWLRLIPYMLAFAAIITLATPFFIEIQSDARILSRLQEIRHSWEGEWIVFLISLIGIPLTILAYRSEKFVKPIQITLLLITTGTLLTYAWNYNPRTTYKAAAFLSPFLQDLKNYNAQNPTPARIYSNPQLIRSMADNTPPKRTDFISPTFTIYQPFQTASSNLSCVNVLMDTGNNANNEITFNLYQDINTAPIKTITVPTQNLSSYDNYPFCFDPIPDSLGKTYWFSLSSKFNSDAFAFAQPTQDNAQKAYFVRKLVNTPANWAASQKDSHIISDPSYGTNSDEESIILARHLQVVAGASSARFIGALSILPYRDFITAFFANDAYPIDGDGLHAIQRNRKLLNFVGVTHLIQALPNGDIDGMMDNGYNLVGHFLTGDYDARLYTNPQAFPKAFLVDNGVSIAAPDDARFAMAQTTFDPAKTVIITGPTPPSTLPSSTNAAEQGKVTITKYAATEVDVDVITPSDTYLVLTDSTTEQWQTYIDGKITPRYIADSVFKTAIVPAGHHQVSFRYYSPAVQKAKYLTIAGIILAILGLLPWQKIIKKKNK